MPRASQVRCPRWLLRHNIYDQRGKLQSLVIVHLQASCAAYVPSQSRVLRAAGYDRSIRVFLQAISLSLSQHCHPHISPPPTMVSILDAQRDSKRFYQTPSLLYSTNRGSVILTTIRQVTHGDVRVLEPLPLSQLDLTLCFSGKCWFSTAHRGG